MKTNKKSVLKKIKDEEIASKSGRVTLYLNLRVYDAFKAACEKEGYPASVVVEKLMEDWISS